MDTTAIERVKLRLRTAHFHGSDGSHTAIRRIEADSGVNVSTIRRLERGQPSRLLLSQVLPIARALRLRLAALLSRADPGPVETWAAGDADERPVDAVAERLRAVLRRRMEETNTGAPRLADRTGLTSSSVSRYRSGAYEVSLTVFDRLATALGDDLGDWLTEACAPDAARND